MPSSSISFKKSLEFSSSSESLSSQSGLKFDLLSFAALFSLLALALLLWAHNLLHGGSNKFIRVCCIVCYKRVTKVLI
ncbi:hypothetical protein QOT17_025201 [Balamuthia mandrillaris]